jgi:hypothetical protein
MQSKFVLFETKSKLLPVKYNDVRSLLPFFFSLSTQNGGF